VDCDASVQQAPSAPEAQQQTTAMPNATQSLHAQQNESALLASLASVVTGSGSGYTAQSMVPASWTAVNTPQRPAPPQQLDPMRPPTSRSNTNAPSIQDPVDTPMVGQPVVTTNYQPAAADIAGQSIITMFGMGMDIDDEKDVKLKVEEDSGDESRVKRRKLGDQASEHT
jgi:hypothetical protein